MANNYVVELSDSHKKLCAYLAGGSSHTAIKEFLDKEVASHLESLLDRHLMRLAQAARDHGWNGLSPEEKDLVREWLQIS